MEKPNRKRSAALWSKLKPKARGMRRKQTSAESQLWQRLRGRQLSGFKFRRQHAIDRFIVDFYCPEARLIIEVDGPVHKDSGESDVIRQEFLESRGLRMLRFTNNQISESLEEVLLKINKSLVP